MPAPEVFWNIRFAASARRKFSAIPRGEADRFAEVVELLRKGPHLLDVEQIDDNLYQYKADNYRIAFEIVKNEKNTVRIIAFERE